MRNFDDVAPDESVSLTVLPAFTLACYGRDPRDEQAVVTDVLARATAATS